MTKTSPSSTWKLALIAVLLLAAMTDWLLYVAYVAVGFLLGISGALIGRRRRR